MHSAKQDFARKLRVIFAWESEATFCEEIKLNILGLQVYDTAFAFPSLDRTIQ